MKITRRQLRKIIKESIYGGGKTKPGPINPMTKISTGGGTSVNRIPDEFRANLDILASNPDTEDSLQEKKKPKKKVDYKKAYKKYHSSKKAKKERAQRNAAGRALKKAGVKIPKGYEIDHKNPISNGGSNDPSNLRVIPKSKNRKLGQKITTKKRKSKGKY